MIWLLKRKIENRESKYPEFSVLYEYMYKLVVESAIYGWHYGFKCFEN
jgi:hypothetical protein